MARKAYVVSEEAGLWSVACEGECLMRMLRREEAILMARSAAHRAFTSGMASAVLVRGADGKLATEWLFGFEEQLRA